MNRLKAIEDFNNPRFGSFGEYVFYKTLLEFKNIEAVNLHKERADFIVNDQKIDVGARRPGSSYDSKKEYFISGKDAEVFFFKDKCVVHCKALPKIFNKPIIIDYRKIQTWYRTFIKSKKMYKSTENKSFSEVSYLKIKKEVVDYFKSNKIKAHVIYRTTSSIFGLTESPGNLIGKKISNNDVNVYIDFNSYDRKKKNIEFIIAFPKSIESTLPMQKKNRLLGNPDKLDLIEVKTLKHNCYFESIEQMKSEYFKRFK